jgi:multidrug efflux pump
VDERDAGGHSEHSAAARRQHHHVVKAIKAVLPQLEVNLPASIKVTPDRLTTGINASVHDVEFELMLTVALVVMVIFSVSAQPSMRTIIPSMAVPLSLVGTFGVMYLLGYSSTIFR